MMDTSKNHSAENIATPTPLEQLWDYADAISGRLSEQESWLSAADQTLSSLNRSLLPMPEKVKFDERVREYELAYIVFQETKDREVAAMEMLERAEAWEASDAEIEEFLPAEFQSKPDEPAENKTTTSREAKSDTTMGIGLSYYDFLFSMPISEAMRNEGRLTTGRNRVRLNAGRNALNGYQAVDAFFFVTADTHGGKVRGAGKNGQTYASKSGKRLRRY